MTMMTIAAMLQSATTRLLPVSTARLDAELLLAQVLGVPRTTLYTDSMICLTEDQQKLYKQLIERRIEGEPIAYLTGHKEFWSLDLLVTPDTLIPRPETELVVETVLELLSASHSHETALRVVDLGTGSGAIALALAKEKPNWSVMGSDQSIEALRVAKTNADRLALGVDFVLSDWCSALNPVSCDVIVSNPPYVAKDSVYLAEGDVRFEPIQALVSGDDGLKAIALIIEQAVQCLKLDGLLVLEHGFDQAQHVRSLFEKFGYEQINTVRDLAGLERVTYGRNSAVVVSK